MSSSTHTPGPWTIAQPWAGFSAIRGAKGELVFGIAAGVEHERQTPEVCEANARLIAASPTMYEALTAIVAGTDDMLSWAQLISQARAALAKANGESL